MRLEESGYGIPALQSFESYLDSFIPVSQQTLISNPSLVAVGLADAQGNPVVVYFQGNLQSGQVSQVQIAAGAVWLDIRGSFAFDGGGNVSGTLTSIRYDQNFTRVAAIYDLSIPMTVDLSSDLISSDMILFAGMDQIYGSAGNDYLIGYAGNDVITGNWGDDTLDGGLGADNMYGQWGNDTYMIDNVADTVNEGFNEGIDQVRTSLNYTIGANIENLSLLGASAIDGTGNELGNVLTGNSGANILSGLSGSDILDGGLGIDVLDGGDGDDGYIVGDNDTIIDSSGSDTVYSYIPWVLGLGLENLTLLGSAAYGVGNEQDNLIIGNGSSNPLLRGLGGNDTIFGGAGNDWIEGESGNDALPVGHVAGNDIIYCEDGDDIVLGGAGDDLAYGGSGTDFLVGELGNDFLYGGSEWDAIDGRQGTDVLYGEGGSDIIFGDGYFYLFGFAGDSMYGGDGDDIMMGEAGEPSTNGASDLIFGENGNDLLDGGGGNDTIYGGAGNDIIDGDHGDDRIVGGAGAEIMLGSNALDYGGPTIGSDVFVYQSLADAGDSIYGFDMRAGDNDTLDLRDLLDGIGYFGATPRASGTEILRVIDSGGNAQVQIDPDGAPGAAAFFTLTTLVNVQATQLTDSYFIF